MTVRSWRIVKAKHRAAAFTGQGARLHGGRWNSKGVAIIYTSGSPALALLEMLVHLEAEELLKHYYSCRLEFDESLVRRVGPSQLPRNWRANPPPPADRRIGDDWAASAQSPVLAVPSVLSPEEVNYLLNPDHPLFGQITIGQFERVTLDRRLR